MRLPWLLWIVVAPVMGCALGDVTAAEGGDVLVVEALLQAGSNRQAVLLHRSLREGMVLGEAGATITITAPDGRAVHLKETSPGICAGSFSPALIDSLLVSATCYITENGRQLPIEPASTYELEVVSARGETVRGRTTVPGAFRGLRPSIPGGSEFPACSLTEGTNFELMWSKSQGAWSYLATIEVTGLRGALEGTGIDAPDRVELTGLAISENDTTLVLPADFGLFELTNLEPDLLVFLQGGFPSGVAVRLRLSALDRNYVNAIRGGSFHPSGAIRISSLIGDGVGVFGSYVARDLLVVVEDESALPPC